MCLYHAAVKRVARWIAGSFSLCLRNIDNMPLVCGGFVNVHGVLVYGLRLSESDTRHKTQASHQEDIIYEYILCTCRRRTRKHRLRMG